MLLKVKINYVDMIDNNFFLSNVQQKYEVEIGSDSIRGAGWLCGAKKDYTYVVPKGTVAVQFKVKDRSSNCLNVGDGNGKATISWKQGDTKAHAHAWVNGAVGSANRVQWKVVAVIIE